MAYRSDNEKVAKLTRAIIDGSARRFKERNLGIIYGDNEAYKDWHMWILTDFQPGDEQQEMIELLYLLYLKKIKINECKFWKMYYASKTSLLSKKISGLTNISKVAWMEQEKEEENIGDIKEWLLFEKDSS